MFVNLRKLLLLSILVLSFNSLLAQAEVIILGKIDNPISQYVAIQYKKNLFTLEDAVYETRINPDNSFAIKVTISEPRAVIFNYKNDKIKLFLTPNDTLKMYFRGDDMLSTLSFEGITALPNKYLLGFVKKFPDLVNEKIVEKERKDKSPRDYQKFVDNLFFEKRRFFDSYPSDDKDYFITDFLEYAANDITYWRTYQLMMYYKEHGLNNPNNARFIDDNYFNFLFDTENVFYKALNNDYYLKFLELYLSYIRERDGEKYGKPLANIVEEKKRQAQMYKPKEGIVWLLEDPFASKNLVASIDANDEVEYLNLITDSKFPFNSKEATYDDIYIKVQTNEGKKGWIPKGLVEKSDKTIVEKIVLSRQCLNPNEPLCGYEAHLHGKVLYYAALRDILLSLGNLPYQEIQKRITAYNSSNTVVSEYNKILKSALDGTIVNKEKNISKLFIPSSCIVDEYKPKEFNFKKPEIIENAPPRSTIKLEKPQLVEAKKPPVTTQPVIEKQAEIARTEVPKTNTTETTKANPPIVEKTVSTATPSVTTTEKLVEKPKNNTVDTTVTRTSTGVNIVIGAKSVNEQPPITKSEKPVETVQKVENKEIDKPIQKTETIIASINNEATLKLISNDKNTQLDTTQAIVPWMDALDYKPDGKPVVFSGLVINEDVPTFKLVDINGNQVSQQDLLGKVVFIDFWASWCGPCQAQLSHTKRLAEKYTEKGVVFIYISMDSDVEAWKYALKEKNLMGIHVNDKTIIPINFLIQGLPNCFIIDKKGKIAQNSLLRSKINDERMIEYLLKM